MCFFISGFVYFVAPLLPDDSSQSEEEMEVQHWRVQSFLQDEYLKTIRSKVCILQVMIGCRAESTNANTRVFVKDFGIRIVKLVLEYSLRSCDPTHMIFLPPMNDTKYNFLSGARSEAQHQYCITVCVIAVN